MPGDLLGRDLRVVPSMRSQPQRNHHWLPCARNGQAQAEAIAARDVPAGASWAFCDHRTMAQVIADEAAVAANKAA